MSDVARASVLCNVLTCGFRSIGTPEVAQLVANLSAIYSPELKVGFTPVRRMCPRLLRSHD